MLECFIKKQKFSEVGFTMEEFGCGWEIISRKSNNVQKKAVFVMALDDSRALVMVPPFKVII